MTFQFTSVDEVNAVRRSLLGFEKAEKLQNQGDSFLIPAEDLVESSPHCFSVVEHRWTPKDASGEPLIPHFGLVRDGTLDFQHYLQTEAQYCDLLRTVLNKANGRCIIQVAYEISPDTAQSIAAYFGEDEVHTIMSLFGALRHERQGVIAVQDVRTMELLMRLGIREIAMSTFALPTLGLCLMNHWDMRLLAYRATASAEEVLDKAALESGLRARKLQP